MPVVLEYLRPLPVWANGAYSGRARPMSGRSKCGSVINDQTSVKARDNLDALGSVALRPIRLGNRLRTLASQPARPSPTKLGSKNPCELAALPSSEGRRQIAVPPEPYTEGVGSLDTRRGSVLPTPASAKHPSRRATSAKTSAPVIAPSPRESARLARTIACALSAVSTSSGSTSSRPHRLSPRSPTKS